VSLFVLNPFRYCEKYPDIKTFLQVRFIVRVTVAFRKEIRNNRSPPHRVSLLGPKVPQFILTLIQGE
jgi:hypothetical protein